MIAEIDIKNLSLNPSERIRSKAFLNILIQNIKEHGLMRPLDVGKTNEGEYIILDGRFRYEALRRLNYSTVLCNIT